MTLANTGKCCFYQQRLAKTSSNKKNTPKYLFAPVDIYMDGSGTVRLN